MRELDASGVTAALSAYWSKGAERDAGRGAITRAIRAYLDATAPSRAPDGGVTRELQTALEELRRAEANSGHSATVTGMSRMGARAILAASRAGDRERHSMEDMPTDRRVLVDFVGQGWLVAYAEPSEPEMLRRCIGFGKSERYVTVAKDYALGWVELPPSQGLAPAAGQDDAGEAQPQADELRQRADTCEHMGRGAGG